ncbi:RNase J family beta-CASP ribonuclease [Mycoplasma anatis]|uniref:ribonuclease J n=1 Tax=Mycoplasmopsis anatis TaxID=171279 RepID=UPI001C4E036F|nr:ribonuclease J [Mycoplasmopsis anatis]MBW0596382.1 RNase J family beta-CASP ribonuclease [Mycoplasmopsis anatis]MBW0600005.1 RNase J family beta-CASP ribonuclease [Mycoplasmopsis anatis]MBW0600769.1 RNase J family beta-CASP ribonuclease [Mycoplasmopsis anatis]
MNPTRIIPLGGVQEIGKATLLIEQDDHIFLIDAGIKFADTFTTGIKGIIPNYSYLNLPDKKVEALFITHGHEDHIGGVVYLVKQTKLKKIFAPKIAISYLKLKFEEHKITRKIEFVEIDKNDSYKFPKGVVVDFWTAQHSIPDAFGVRITTPHGKIMCTGDFRFDYTPIGNYTDFARLDEIGKQGLTALLSDSTNAMRPYHSPSEKDILIDIKKHMENAKRKIIITAFASNLTRVKVIIELAAQLNKKIVTFGRSMIQGIKIGRKLGYIDVPSDIFIDKKQLSSIDDSKLVVLTTGSQGEQLAALSRMSYGKHPSIKISKGDTVIFSSSPIPGNRMVIELLINRLYKLGATIKENGTDGYLHTSGHAYRHEHDKIFQLTKPKYFIPYHGEYRMSIVHGQSAVENGVDSKNIIIPEPGRVYLMKDEIITPTNETIDYGPIYIDGTSILNTNAALIKERAKLGTSGFVSTILTINKKTNSIIGKPQIISRGAFFVKNSTKLIEETKRIVHGSILHCIRNISNWTIPELKQLIIDRLSTLYHKERRRVPLIIPIFNIIEQDESKEKNNKNKKDKKLKVTFESDQKTNTQQKRSGVAQAEKIVEEMRKSITKKVRETEEHMYNEMSEDEEL